MFYHKYLINHNYSHWVLYDLYFESDFSVQSSNGTNFWSKLMSTFTQEAKLPRYQTWQVVGGIGCLKYYPKLILIGKLGKNIRQVRVFKKFL